MEILSLAWQTDLALLESAGSVIEQRGTYLVVRTPGNAGYRWGNFVLLRRTPLRRDLAAWEQVFATAFPDATYRAFGVDDPDGDHRSLRPFADARYQLEVSAVMTARQLAPPRHRTAVEIRQLRTDADWEQRVALSTALFGDSEVNYVDFALRRATTERAMSQAGLGEWFGVFVGGAMVSGIGVFVADRSRTGGPISRFQGVETHPSHRRRGYAAALVHAAGQHALTVLGASSLLIVAEPDQLAYRIYTRAGFTRTESQLQAIKLPRRPRGLTV